MSEGRNTMPAGRELAVLRGVQTALSGRPPVVRAARALSLFGEHGAGWFALGLVGAAADRRRRRQWLAASAGVLAAHGAAIAVKRVVRRPRPDDPQVQVLVGTPSRLSFPSSHAASTTAAAVLYGGLTRQPVAVSVIPPMLVSRMVLGVHYPSDVVAGSVLGAAIGGVVLRWLRRERRVT
ncbi:MAG TPA: phosphatase PAP2 family protein [Pseudonocardiaceae bacterium]